MSIAQTTAATDPLAVLGANPRFYIVPERRVMFVSVAKNACTTLKWMIAEVAGEDLGGFTAKLRPYLSETGAVHTRELWRRALMPSQVPPELRAQIHPDNGWFVFAVVRDPRVRLFSAWEDKLLLNNPYYYNRMGASWYPGFPSSREQIVAEFARFVDALVDDPGHPLLIDDTHFRRQTGLLRRDLVSYSRIYDIRELADLRADLAAHLAATGWHGELRMRSDNGSPLAANPAVFANGVAAKIERIYQRDFAAFGTSWDLAAIEAKPDWSDADLRLAQVYATLGQRIGELRSMALASNRRVEQLATQLAKRERDAAARANTLPRRVARRLPDRARATLRRLRTATRGR